MWKKKLDLPDSKIWSLELPMLMLSFYRMFDPDSLNLKTRYGVAICFGKGGHATAVEVVRIRHRLVGPAPDSIILLEPENLEPGEKPVVH